VTKRILALLPSIFLISSCATNVYKLCTELEDNNDDDDGGDDDDDDDDDDVDDNNITNIVDNDSNGNNNNSLKFLIYFRVDSAA
jgi:hypothetical protein